MNILYLHSLIAAQAPIDGVSVADATDKSTWRVDFQAGATAAQRTAAQSVIDNYDPLTPTQAETDYFKQLKIDAIDAVQLQIAFNHENRIRALEGGKQPITATQFKTAVKALF